MPCGSRGPWTGHLHPRTGDGTGFDRVVFSDAVFDIALTLMAVEIVLAFAVTFLWVAFWLVLAVVSGLAVARWLPASPP